MAGLGPRGRQQSSPFMPSALTSRWYLRVWTIKSQRCQPTHRDHGAGTGCMLNMIPVNGHENDPNRTSIDQALLPVLNGGECGRRARSCSSQRAAGAQNGSIPCPPPPMTSSSRSRRVVELGAMTRVRVKHDPSAASAGLRHSPSARLKGSGCQRERNGNTPRREATKCNQTRALRRAASPED